jgi:hypothetical protein
MDRINKYRQIVQEFLTEFAIISPNYQLIFDTTRDSPRRGFANDIYYCTTNGAVKVASMDALCS